MLLDAALAWLGDRSRPQLGALVCVSTTGIVSATLLFKGLRKRNPNKVHTFKNELSLAKLRSKTAWSGMNGEEAFQDINKSGSGSITPQELCEAWLKDQKKARPLTQRGLSCFQQEKSFGRLPSLMFYAKSNVEANFANAIGTGARADDFAPDSGRDTAIEHCTRLVQRFDADSDGVLRPHEFLVLLRQWSVKENNEKPSTRSRRNCISKMLFSTGVLSTSALLAAPYCQMWYHLFSWLSASAASLLLGFGLICGGIFAVESIPPVMTQALDDENSLECIQPTERLQACGLIVVGGGFLVAPLYALLHAISDGNGKFPNTMYWQFVLAPSCCLLGAAGWFEFRTLAAKIAAHYRPTPKPTVLTLVADSVATLLSGLGSSVLGGTVAHLCGAKQLRNMLLAPSVTMRALDPAIQAKVKLVQHGVKFPNASAGSLLERFVIGPGAKNMGRFAASLDPAQVQGGDNLYILTLLGLGSVIAYHSARLWLRHERHGDSDHLSGSMDLMVDFMQLLVYMYKKLWQWAWERFKQKTKNQR